MEIKIILAMQGHLSVKSITITDGFNKIWCKLCSMPWQLYSWQRDSCPYLVGKAVQDTETLSMSLAVLSQAEDCVRV